MKTSAGIILSLCIFFSCGETGSGKIGIHVPVGAGRVTKDTPYVITALFEGSPADRSGIKPDDIITEINGRPVHGLAYDYIYKEMLAGGKGEALTLTVSRGGSFLVFRIVRE